MIGEKEYTHTQKISRKEIRQRTRTCNIPRYRLIYNNIKKKCNNLTIKTNEISNAIDQIVDGLLWYFYQILIL